MWSAYCANNLQDPTCLHTAAQYVRGLMRIHLDEIILDRNRIVSDYEYPESQNYEKALLTAIDLIDSYIDGRERIQYVVRFLNAPYLYTYRRELVEYMMYKDAIKILKEVRMQKMLITIVFKLFFFLKDA